MYAHIYTHSIYTFVPVLGTHLHSEEIPTSVGVHLHGLHVRLSLLMIIPVGQSQRARVPSPSVLGTEKQKTSHPPLLTAHPLDGAAAIHTIELMYMTVQDNNTCVCTCDAN